MSDKIEISCPHCDGIKHAYSLTVKRSYAIGLFGFGRPEPTQRRKRFTRYFNCLAGKGRFQATFALLETDMDAIATVDVGD